MAPAPASGASVPTEPPASPAVSSTRVVRLGFLFDVDNTLLDNDRVKAEIVARGEELLGRADGGRFWQIYEEVRRERDFVDYPETLTRFRAEHPDEPCFPRLADFILGYPYRRALYRGALAALAHANTLGEAAILSDGDPVYQPAKVARAGLAAAVADRVFIYAHKEAHLDEVAERLPADRYVLVEDKERILAAAKAHLGARLFTVHVRQGHYGTEDVGGFVPDVVIERIAELRRIGAEAFGG